MIPNRKVMPAVILPTHKKSGGYLILNQKLGQNLKN